MKIFLIWTACSIAATGLIAFVVSRIKGLKVIYTEFDTQQEADFASVEKQIKDSKNASELNDAFESWKTFKGKYCDEMDGVMDTDLLFNMHNAKYQELPDTLKYTD